MPRELDNFFSIQQQDGESLKDYMTWFKSIILEIYNLDEPVAMLTIKRCLHSSKFTYFLDKIYPKFYLELLTYTQKYLCMEEVVAIWWETDRKPKKKRPKKI